MPYQPEWFTRNIAVNEAMTLYSRVIIEIHIRISFFLLLQYVGYALSWDCCLLHLNQLPPGHLLEKYEGKSKDSDKLPNGELGMLMKKWEELQHRPIVKFEPIPCPVLDDFDIENSDFNDDVRKLLEWGKAVSSG